MFNDNIDEFFFDFADTISVDAIAYPAIVVTETDTAELDFDNNVFESWDLLCYLKASSSAAITRASVFLIDAVSYRVKSLKTQDGITTFELIK